MTKQSLSSQVITDFEWTTGADEVDILVCITSWKQGESAYFCPNTGGEPATADEVEWFINKSDVSGYEEDKEFYNKLTDKEKEAIECKACEIMREYKRDDC